MAVKHNNNGMTMVEIVIAFSVLAVVMLVLYGSITFSGKLVMRASDIDRDNAAYESAVADEFSKEGAYELGTGGNVSYSFTVKDEAGNPKGSFSSNFYLVDVYFTPNAVNVYSKTNSSTSDSRTIRMFSTGGDGSSGTTKKHKLIYMIKKSDEGIFRQEYTFVFNEGTGVTGHYIPAAPDGYSFGGWYEDEALSVESTDILETTKNATADVIIYGEFELISTTADYTIEYMLEKPSLDGFKIGESKKVETVAVDSTVTITDTDKKTFPGFTYDPGANNIESAVVKADGTSKLVLYYKRNIKNLTYNILYSDGSKSVKKKEYTYGGYDSLGNEMTGFLAADPDTKTAIPTWYTDEACTSAYGFSSFKTATDDVVLYAKVTLPEGAPQGVDNMEVVEAGKKFSDRVPDLTEINDFRYNPYGWPYRNDGGSGHTKYVAMADKLKSALEAFGYKTDENAFISADKKGDGCRIYILDTSENGLNINLNSDMSLKEMYDAINAYTGYVNEQNAGQYSKHCYIELPESAVAVYETKDFVKYEKLNLAEEPLVYLVFELNVYSEGGEVNANSQAYLSETKPW